MAFNWNTIDNNRLLKMFRSAETPNELRAFLDDLISEKDLQKLSIKVNAAFMLLNGAPYTTVSSLTGLSTATLSKISKSLSERHSGYGLLLQRIYPRSGDFYE